MTKTRKTGTAQKVAEKTVKGFEKGLGPFVVAADKTRMPMLFTDAHSAENRIIYVNQSFLELTGYRESDAIGLPFDRLIASEMDGIKFTPQVIADRYEPSIQLRCVRRDGTQYDAAVLVSPVRDRSGELQQYFASFVDVTEHVERCLKDRLREAEIYRHAPGFVAFSEGPEHRLTFANTAFELLVGRRDLVGQSAASLFPELAGQGFIEMLDKVYSSGCRTIGKNTPIRLVRGPNSQLETRYIDFIYEPVRDASDNVVGVFCEGSDITDAQRTSERLNDVQAQLMHVSRLNAMGTMAATLAHEINQPLAAIANYASGCVNILEEGKDPSERLREGLFAIAAASERAGKIIRQLRDMTKRTAPVREVFDLSTALEEAVHLVRAGGCENVQLTTQSTRSALVLGDKIQVQQVIINLLRNACFAADETDKAGTVAALSTVKDGKACIVVQDNGPGLPNGSKEDVFAWTKSAKPDGMGIGLSICRTIAKAHAGEIFVDRTGPSGTSFILSLPSFVTGEIGAVIPK